MFLNKKMKYSKKGFTLLELLIVIAIIAILAGTVLTVINPAELLKKSRDSRRASDLSSLRDAIGLYITGTSNPQLDGTSTANLCSNHYWYSNLYSFAGSCPSGKVCIHPSSTASSTQVDSTGWLPVNFLSIQEGSPISSLPLDPVNNSTYYYVYACDEPNLTFEINTKFESIYYTSSTNLDGRDGGDASDYYEVGTDPGLDLIGGTGGSGNQPTADFTASPTSGDAPLSVSFTDQSTNNPTSWSWDFGDGQTTTTQNPTHTYSSTGTYDVSLTVTNSNGSSSLTRVDYIYVTSSGGGGGGGANPPTANFTASPTSGDAPLSVSFTDQSTNNPTSWSWDFGDGQTTTTQNPTHTYSSAGTYDVSLTVANNDGTSTLTRSNYISVTSGGGGQSCNYSTTTFGSETTFDTGHSTIISIDSLDSSHFVIAYAGNSLVGLAVVGTVSGTSTITYGATTTFSDYIEDVDVAALDSTHFVVVYQAGYGTRGTSTIGTISGTSISFDSKYSLNSDPTYYLAVDNLDSTHFVVAYEEYSGSSYYGKAVVGTVSGSTISYGSESTFNSGAISYSSLAALDSTHFVISYRDSDNNGYGTAVIGVVSGTSIAFGSEYVFEQNDSMYTSVSSINSTRFVIGYNFNSIKAVIGNLSSTSTINFGTSATISDSGNAGKLSVSALDSTHFVINYADPAYSGQKGKSLEDNDFSWNPFKIQKAYADGQVSKGVSVIGAISGTSTISFGDKSKFTDQVLEKPDTTTLGTCQFVVGFTGEGTSEYGKSIIGNIQ